MVHVCIYLHVHCTCSDCFVLEVPVCYFQWQQQFCNTHFINVIILFLCVFYGPQLHLGPRKKVPISHHLDLADVNQFPT